MKYVPPSDDTAVPQPAASADATPVPVVKPTVAPAPQPVALQNQAPAPAPAPLIHRCPRPLTRTDLTLGSDAADARRLAAPLRTGHAVTVDLLQPYGVRADPPASLAPWFAEVRAKGGTVDLNQYCEQAGRGFLNWLFSRRPIQEPGTSYRAGARYNVVLHADALAQKVTQVEFVPKRKAH